MARVSLPDHPFIEAPAWCAAPDRLDRLAGEFLQKGTPADPARFLFGFLATRVFGALLSDEPDLESARERVWLMHLSGYFGGVWLRRALRTSDPTQALLAAGAPPTEASVLATAKRAHDQLLLLSREAGDAVAAAESALSDLTRSFGYNRGYLMQIVEAPPRGVAAPLDGLVSPGGLLWCDYTRPVLTLLSGLRPVAAEIDHLAKGGDPRFAPLVTLQRDAEARGRQVWSLGLSIEGFDATTYEQLLDVSSSFLQVVQATALTDARAVLRRSALDAGRAALARAALVPWLESYSAGLMDPRHDSLPEPPMPTLRA